MDYENNENTKKNALEEVADNKIIYKFDSDKKAFTSDELITESSDTFNGHIEIYIEKTVIPDSQNYQYYVTIKDDETKAIATSSIDDIQKSVTELVNAGVIDLTQRINLIYLDNLIKYAIREVIKDGTKASRRHYVVGWDEISNDDAYFGNDIVYASNPDSPVSSIYDNNDVVKLSRDGTLNSWIEANRNHIVLKIIPSLTIVSAFVGVIRQRYKSLRDGTQVILNLVGESSIGKSSLVKSAYTVFRSGEQIDGYNATSTSRIQRIVEHNPLVFSIDDILQMRELNTKNKGNINEIIFELYSGERRDKFEKYGQSNKKQHYESTIILTSVESLLEYSGNDIGQFSRLIEIRLERDDIAVDSEDARIMVDSLESNHGWAAEAFAQALLQEEKRYGGKKAFGEHLKKEFNDIKARLTGIEVRRSGNDADYIYLGHEDKNETQGNVIRNTRLANAISIIILTANLLNDYFSIGYPVEEIEEYLISVANRQLKEAKRFDRSISGKKTKSIEQLAKEGIYQVWSYFKNNKSYFHNGIILQKENAESYLGIYDTNTDGGVILNIKAGDRYKNLYYILRNANPEDIINQEGNLVITHYEAFEDILREWREEGILDTKNKNTLTNKKRLQTNDKQPEVHRLKFSKELIEQLESKAGDTVVDRASKDTEITN